MALDPGKVESRFGMHFAIERIVGEIDNSKWCTQCANQCGKDGLHGAPGVGIQGGAQQLAEHRRFIDR